MHILFTAYEFVTENKPCGGCGHYLANIATVLANHGHEVTVLVLSDKERDFYWKDRIEVVTFPRQYINHGIHIEWALDSLLKLDCFDYVNKSLAFQVMIKKIHKRKKIDIIQHNGDHLECWHRNWHIPTVIRLSSFTPWYKMAYDQRSDMNDMSWLNSWESRMFLYPLIKADAVYTPSQCVAGFVNRKLPGKVQVIESPYIPVAEGNVVTDEYELFNKKYFLFVGRLCVLKGINTIIQSIHTVLEENPDFYFVFAGNVENKGIDGGIKRAASIYQDRVLILGEIKEKEKVQEYIKHAFACVLPSRADNLPNSCIEAMGLGRIVIGTYGASFEQLIRHKKSGILIQRDSSKALIKAIRYVVSMSDEERKEMGNAAKERIKKLQSDVIYNQLISFYDKTIKRKIIKF